MEEGWELQRNFREGNQTKSLAGDGSRDAGPSMIYVRGGADTMGE